MCWLDAFECIPVMYMLAFIFYRCCFLFVRVLSTNTFWTLMDGCYITNFNNVFIRTMNVETIMSWIERCNILMYDRTHEASNHLFSFKKASTFKVFRQQNQSFFNTPNIILIKVVKCGGCLNLEPQTWLALPENMRTLPAFVWLRLAQSSLFILFLCTIIWV